MSGKLEQIQIVFLFFDNAIFYRLLKFFTWLTYGKNCLLFILYSIQQIAQSLSNYVCLRSMERRLRDGKCHLCVCVCVMFEVFKAVEI